MPDGNGAGRQKCLGAVSPGCFLPLFRLGRIFDFRNAEKDESAFCEMVPVCNELIFRISDDLRAESVV